MTMEYASSPTSRSWTTCTPVSTETGAGTWYVRYKENATQKASSATEVIVTEPTYTIAVDSHSLTFKTKNAGYDNGALRQSVTVTNTGNSKVTLEEPSSLNYSLSLSHKEIEPNGTATLTIVPKNKLSAGVYKETIEIRTAQKTLASVNVQFKVNGALNVSLNASATNIIEGQSATLIAKVQGGSGKYSYTWYADGIKVPELTKNEVVVSPIATTTYKVIVEDTIENKEATLTMTIVSKRYDLKVPMNITLDSQYSGYKNVSAKSIQIQNTGNIDATNIRAILTGRNADAFTLDTNALQTALSPNRETTISVKPKAGLLAGTYTAKIQIQGDVGINKTIDITFTVKDQLNHESVETEDKTSLMLLGVLLIGSGIVVYGAYKKKRTINS